VPKQSKKPLSFIFSPSSVASSLDRMSTVYNQEGNHTANTVCIVLGLLRFLKPKPKPRVFPKTDGNRTAVFWRQMKGFLRLDNRQDLTLQPNWDRRNNNEERACLSAPFITSLVSQSRGLQYTKHHLCLNVQ